MTWNQRYYILMPKILSFMGITTLLALLKVLTVHSCYIMEFKFLFSQSSDFQFILLLDWVSLIFMCFILLISSVVMFYSTSYMKEDYNVNRFFLILLTFILSMLLLTCSLNMISILLGWDGLGISSYLLVVYYQNEKSNGAGMLTILMNRIGDVAILMMIGLMCETGSWNFTLTLETNTVQAHLIILAAMTKSAQIPFSAWLPAAMAAPTPVSSLVHSSTLVTAGVYLLIRFESWMSPNVKMFMFLMSSMTMLLGSTSANMSTDLKKIIALSTLSQLGVMISIIVSGYPLVGLFHLLTHAIFKSLMFLCAGKMIHNMTDTQDIRNMGALTKSMPFSSFILSLSMLALVGFPFMAGFYSKDLLIESVSLSMSSSWVNLVFFISTGLSAFYSLRMFYHLNVKPWSSPSLSFIQENDNKMYTPLLLLAVFAIFIGSSLSWVIFMTPVLIVITTFHKLSASLATLSGFFMANMILSTKMPMKLKNFMSLFLKMWFLTNLNLFLKKSVLFLSLANLKIMDMGWLEHMGAQGIFYASKNPVKSLSVSGRKKMT